MPSPLNGTELILQDNESRPIILVSQYVASYRSLLFVPVPSIAPPGVTVLEMFSMNELIVKWNAINNDQANGRFKGYKVRYRVVRVSSKATSATSRVSEIVVDKYTFTLKLFDLESYTTYAVSVLGYTEAGDGPISTPIDAGKSQRLFSSIMIFVFIDLATCELE